MSDRSRRRSGGLYGSNAGNNLARTAAAEFVGTFILIFGGTAVATGAILDQGTAGPAYDSLAVALAFGIALIAIVASIGHISGAHVNPAVTISLAATGKLPWNYVPFYIVAQLFGAIFGSIATWITFGAAARSEANLAATFPTQGVGDFQALLVEILVTFILVFAVVSVATDDRVAPAVAPIAVGAALTVGVFIAGPVTGGSLNPARSLGPMIVSGQFSSVWVYIVGPIIGGVAAAFLYDRFIAKGDAPE